MSVHGPLHPSANANVSILPNENVVPCALGKYSVMVTAEQGQGVAASGSCCGRRAGWAALLRAEAQHPGVQAPSALRFLTQKQEGTLPPGK